MARVAKKTEPAKVVPTTRAEKKDAVKNLVREILKKPRKHNELIEEAAKLYTARFEGADTENINDVKGRVGSVVNIMKEDGDVTYEGGIYALKAAVAEKKKSSPKTKKAAKSEQKPAEEPVKEEAVQEETAPKKRGRKPKAESAETQEKTKETAKKKKAEPLPPAPIQPIAPVAPVTPEVAPEPIPEDTAEKTEETPAPKKRGRKPKTKTEPIAPEKPEEPVKEEIAPAQKAETVEEPKAETKELVVREKAEVAPKSVVMDMSFLFGDRKQKAPAPVKEEKKAQSAQKPAEEKAAEKPVSKVEKKETAKPVQKQAAKSEIKTEKVPMSATNVRKTVKLPVKNIVKKALSAEEKLKETFLKKLSYLGGEYFEYYSVYLLERYSMKNGRRLEGLRISGGDRDGGIDGEIELTDRLGFRETIYIQAKGWNPEKGDEKLWVVGETLLQQFIGACACRQAKERKQHCRGIFITTSRFTPEAKQILEDMSDKIVGYDGNDLFEAAKECSFGLIQKNGEWTIDERLLSGTKAFFHLY